jgi:hypothetical protein
MALRRRRPKMIRGRFCERALKPARLFAKKSFRWKKVGGRNWLLFGCPKGKWSPKGRVAGARTAGRCKVGTQGHKILIRAKSGKACCAKRRPGQKCVTK